MSFDRRRQDRRHVLDSLWKRMKEERGGNLAKAAKRIGLVLLGMDDSANRVCFVHPGYENLWHHVF